MDESKDTLDVRGMSLAAGVSFCVGIGDGGYFRVRR